ncbi:MAG: imidazolonepropionase [Bacteroidales bacterium]|nr:imidazolonepropionase [Lentimicrobiaceae bacterium]MDD5694972.1 imidazolonepropionase [Bacteroidales bacterium]
MLLINNIKELIQTEGVPRRKVSGAEMAILPTVKDAYLFIRDGLIADFGRMEDMPLSPFHEQFSLCRVMDASGRMVLPCWCDSHTHLVYPASREMEYVDKIRGMTYEEIAKRGGGILNSAEKLKAASEEELLRDALGRIQEIIRYGTGAVEIKSGYGLTLEGEVKMLRVIKKLKELTPLTIRANFLGAHAVPMEFRANREKYVDIVVNEMIPFVAQERLADFVDVFCDRGFFSVEDTGRILAAAVAAGLKPKIHANELDYSGGVQIGVKHGALSVDHLEHVGEEEISVLLGSQTMPTILPGAAFFLGLNPAPARRMIDAGLPLAMASDYNPGSSPSGNMQLMLSLGSIVYKLLPEEGLHAVTINGAYAMDVADSLGSIAIGKKANVFITVPVPSYSYLPYSFGDNKVETVILNGEVVEVFGRREAGGKGMGFGF